MLMISKRIDRRNPGVVRKVDDVLLGKSPDDAAMHHPSQNSCGIFDWFTTAELDVVLGKEHDIASKFSHADLERDSSPGRCLGKDHSPGLTFQGQRGVLATFCLHPSA